MPKRKLTVSKKSKGEGRDEERSERKKTREKDDHHPILPVDIIKIICDYLDIEDPDPSAFNVDVSGVVAKMFGKKFAPQSFWATNHGENFMPHHHFPEVYLEKIFDGLVIYDSNLPKNARVSSEFIIKYASRHRINFDAFSEEDVQRDIDQTDRAIDIIKYVVHRRKLSLAFLERNKMIILAHAQRELSQNKHLPIKFVRDNEEKFDQVFWFQCVNLEISRAYIIEHAARCNIANIVERHDFEVLFEKHFNNHSIENLQNIPLLYSKRHFLGETFFRKYPQLLHDYTQGAVIGPKFATEYWGTSPGLDRVAIFENPHVGEKFLEQRLKKLSRSERKKLKPELNRNHSLSSDFWDRHLDLAIIRGPDSLAKNPNLSVDFIYRHRRGLNLAHVFQYNDQLPSFLIRETIFNFLSEQVL